LQPAIFVLKYCLALLAQETSETGYKPVPAQDILS